MVFKYINGAIIVVVLLFQTKVWASETFFPALELSVKLENNRIVKGLHSQIIVVRPRLRKIPIEDLPIPQAPKPYLAVLHPFAIVWDIITAPIILVYMYSSQ